MCCACFAVRLLPALLCCGKYYTEPLHSLLRSREKPSNGLFISEAKEGFSMGVVCFSEVCLLVESGTGISDSDQRLIK